AGSAKMLVFVSATLSDATWQMSGLVILMTLIGGMGTLVGPILGAFIVVLLENKVGDFGRFMAELTGNSWFLRLGESVTIVIGLIFIICVLAFRRGIVGEWQAYLARRRPRTQAGAAQRRRARRRRQRASWRRSSSDENTSARAMPSAAPTIVSSTRSTGMSACATGEAR